jgi:hypothetical protein
VGLAFRLGVLPSAILAMPECDFLHCVAYLNLESKERDNG